jgi:rubredoxin
MAGPAILAAAGITTSAATVVVAVMEAVAVMGAVVNTAVVAAMEVVLEVAAALEVWVPAAECYCQRPSTYLSAPLPPARTSWPRHAGGPNARPGDWTCPSCGANVFASKMSCFKCQAPKPVQTFNPGAPPMGGMGGGGPPPGRDVRPGDWTCPNCEANVFASKNTCFRCNTPKP